MTRPSLTQGGFFEDAALLGVHALDLGTEFPGLQARQLKCEALDLGVAPLDGLRLGVDLLGSAHQCVSAPTDLGSIAKSYAANQGFQLRGQEAE
jgi:hypothetical protein